MNSKVKVIKPSGIFDGRKGRQVNERVINLIDSGFKTFLIDFQSVNFMDSAGFGTLILTLKTVKDKQGRLGICAINDQISMILDISGTATAFEVFSDQESFVKTVNQVMTSKVKVIKPSGIFDGKKGRQINERVSKLLDSGFTTFLIDFQAVNFMDSAGFGTLILTLKTVKDHQGHLSLCGINEQIKMILDISGTTNAFEIFPDQESFIKKATQYQT
ncbi:MAG: STAS domain-containing protein [Nostoc sp. TH1S01]|nr:STAS domain-containing protein [Nostoc sp. TH1S01]